MIEQRWGSTNANIELYRGTGINSSADRLVGDDGRNSAEEHLINVSAVDCVGENAISCVIPAHDVGAGIEVIHELHPRTLAGNGRLLDAVDVESGNILVGDSPCLPPEAESTRTDQRRFHPG